MIIRSRLVAQAVLVWGEKHWELFKTFLTDQLKLLMEGLMDPSKPQKYLADQEMYRMYVARQREKEASRQDILCYLHHCLQSCREAHVTMSVRHRSLSFSLMLKADMCIASLAFELAEGPC